jgi:hypothetical protein
MTATNTNATNTNATNTTTTTTTNNDEVVAEGEKVADEDDDADIRVDGSKGENPQKMQEEEELKRIPSIGNAFLIYAVLPLFLFMLPTIIMQLITMDYSSSISESLAFFGLSTRNDTMSTATTTSTSPPFNIDREMVSGSLCRSYVAIVAVVVVITEFTSAYLLRHFFCLFAQYVYTNNVFRNTYTILRKIQGNEKLPMKYNNNSNNSILLLKVQIL